MSLKFDSNGLIPAVVQDAQTKQILMVAWMDALALQRTQETGKAHFWSRSRQELWLKSETSGNFMLVEDIYFDCDGDTLLLEVNPTGPACHTGEASCFFRKLENENAA
jgi:phosphoribosyl-AMP cyclohydrolase